MNDVSRSFRGNSNAARDIAHHLHPYTNFKKHEETGPLIIVRGSGVYVYDDDGKEYIEGMAGLWSAALGFGNERLVQAAVRADAQAAVLPRVQPRNRTSRAIDLAEMLIADGAGADDEGVLRQLGLGGERHRRQDGLVINNALGRPQRRRSSSRLKGYHGITVASASLTGLPANHRSFDLPIAGVVHTLHPHHYRGAKPGETEDAVRDALRRGARGADPQGRRRRHGGGHVRRAGDGCRRRDRAAAPTSRRSRRCCEVRHAARRRRGDLRLLAHRQLLGQPDADIKPDILTCAKALSASYLPISAVMVNEKVYQALIAESDKIGTFGHGFTYSGHPVAAAVAIETQKIYDEMDLFGHAAHGPIFTKHLESFADHPLVGEAWASA